MKKYRFSAPIRFTIGLFAFALSSAAAAAQNEPERNYTTDYTPFQIHRNPSRTPAKSAQPLSEAEANIRAAVATAPALLEKARSRNTLVLVDGVRADAKTLRTFDVTRVAAIEEIEPSVAIKRFGRKAASGALVVTTRAKNDVGASNAEVDGFTQRLVQ